jgi:hypothetical protein
MRHTYLRCAVAVAAAASAGAAGATTGLRGGAGDPAAPPYPPPFWGPTWTAPFNQTITLVTLQYHNEVAWYYDSTSQPVGTSLYEHSRGQNDEWCTMVRPNSDEPCSLLAAADGWRYVIFPETQSCCRACNVSDYCGIVRPDWLQTNATYQGPQTIDGATCYGWMKQGGEQNYWYATASGQPCLYFEGYPVLPFTSNVWAFHMANFSRSPIDPSTFAVPAGWGCESACNLTETPYAERLEARWRAGIGGLSRVGA